MIYKITLSGKGSESYIHELNNDQIDSLKSLDLENTDSDEISNILDKNDIFETDEIILGPYSHPENYYIEVFDENEDIIWKSEDEHEFEDCHFNCVFDNPDDKVLIVEDYVKGQFLSFTIETESFDPKKLIPVITEISERIEVITGMFYGEQDLSESKDYLDYWSKGITYHLND